MTKEEQLDCLEQIEKDIYVCSLESTLADDLKSCAIHSAIEELKQRKTSVWVAIDQEPHETWECGLCGFVIDGSCCIDPDEYRDIYKYCPNCGAKMESEEA